MPAARYHCPLDLLEQKLQIEKRLGGVRAPKYFSLFKRFLALRISKCEFDRLCIAIIGRDVIPLHNHFVRSILKRACTSDPARPRKSTVDSSWNAKTPNGCNDVQFLCKDIPQSPRKGRTPNLRERRFRDRHSPLGSHGKSSSSIAIEDSVPKIHEQQSNVELQSAYGRPHLCVEDGEEVDQDFEILNNRLLCPVEAPLGIPAYDRSARKISGEGLVSSTAEGIGELLDTCSLQKRLGQELEKEELNVSLDATNLLNKALDVYLKRLIKPCLDLVASKSVNKFSAPIPPRFDGLPPMKRSVQNPIGGVSVSISDLKTAMELDPTILGENWTSHLEKICVRASKE